MHKSYNPSSLNNFLFTLCFVAILSVLAVASTARAQTFSPSFQAPATRHLEIGISDVPSAAQLGGTIYLAYPAQNGNGNMYITSTTDCVNFATPTQLSPTISGSPSIAVLQGRIYLAYKDRNDGGVYVITSIDGVTFTTPQPVFDSSHQQNVQSTYPPSVVNFQNTIYVASVDIYSGGVFINATYDGINFSASRYIDGTANYQAVSTPGMTVLNNTLIIGIQSANHMLVTYTSTDSNNWNSPTAYPGVLMGTAPNLSTYQSKLLVVFQGNDKYHLFYQTTGTTAATLFSPAIGYKNSLVGSAIALIAPTGFPYPIYGFFKSNDKYNLLYVTQAQ